MYKNVQTKKWESPTNDCWYQSSRVIALSCGIKISAVHHVDLSQSTRVTDGRTDRITTPKTALAYARAVKTFLTPQPCSENFFFLDGGREGGAMVHHRSPL